MKIEIVSFSRSGGAGAVASALENGLLGIGHEVNRQSKIDTTLRDQPLTSPSMTIRAATDSYLVKKSSWPSLFSHYRDFTFRNTLVNHDYDSAILSWPLGMLGEKDLEGLADKPVLWRMPDMYPFTGGCHYAGDCNGFETDCSECPAVNGIFKNRVQESLSRKTEIYARLRKLHFVAPSDWMRDQFAISPLAQKFGVSTIVNPISQPFLENQAPKTMVEGQKIRLGFAAANLDDPTKGYAEVREFLMKMCREGTITLDLAGEASHKFLKTNSYANFWGRQGTLGMRDFYDSIDILLIPSNFEALGLVSIEAQSRGTPVIVREVGGLSSTVTHGGGWVYKDSKELESIIKNAGRDYSQKSIQGVNQSKLHSEKEVAGKYSDLLQTLLGKEDAK